MADRGTATLPSAIIYGLDAVYGSTISIVAHYAGAELPDGGEAVSEPVLQVGQLYPK